MIDSTEILQMVAEFSDQLDAEYGSGCEIGTFAIVCEVLNHDQDWTAILYRCNDGRSWVQAGLFHEAEKVVDVLRMPREQEDEDDE